MTSSVRSSVFPIRREYRNLAVALALAAAVALAFALRLWGIELRSLSLAEIHAPGISDPSPRQGLAETVRWHFHDDPRPMGWHVAMLGWTKAFGTSHFALQFPGVMLAVGSIPLIFLIARSVFGSTIGCLAALLLALHGFHIFWSQMAEMFVAGTFLSLLSTWLLLRLARARVPRPGIEISYIASVMAGVLTARLFWPLILIHLFWTMLVLPRYRPESPHLSRRISLPQAPRLFQVQALACILSAPALIHAVYHAPKDAGIDLPSDFLMGYFSFGFLFAKDEFAVSPLQIGPAPSGFLLAFALLLLTASLKAPKREAPLASPERKIPARVLASAAICSAGFMFWLAPILNNQTLTLTILPILPFLALLFPVLGTIWGAFVPRLPSATLHYPQERTLLLWLLAVVAPLILFATSNPARPTLLIFVPYLLILCAAGAIWLFQSIGRRLAVTLLCVLVFTASVPYTAQKPVITDARRGALSGYEKTLKIEKLQAHAELFEPGAKP